MTTEEAGPGAGSGATTRSDTLAGSILVLLIDDKLIVREGVRALLDQIEGVQVVGTAASVGDAVALDVEPDVVITDLVLPDARGADVVTRVRARFENAAVVVLTEVEASPQIELMVAAGVSAYVPTRASTDDFVAGIRSAAVGRAYVHASVGGEAGRPGHETTGERSLTPNEREVVRLLVLGHTNAEIAGLCAVSLRTIEARRARVLRKLGVRTRAELVRLAPHLGTSDIDLV